MNLSQYLTKEHFYRNFIADDRYLFFFNGLKVTLTVTLFSVIFGIIIGFLVGTVRSTHEKTGKLKLLNAIAGAYLSIIRGTPVLVQLMIMYFIVFSSPDASKMVTAVLTFAINSGAYVAEIFRSGILSIDNGQFEAGRSLGFNYAQTIWYIVLPQAFKNVLPPLCNEFIALLKETSVVSFIALQDLTRAGDLVRSRTYNPVLPLITVAFIYWIIVTILTKLVGILERRLRKSER
ncbi:MAG: amino acid ABC transporter permease [bacterium]|nr:amino acid ABC transporter permease [bacterium]